MLFTFSLCRALANGTRTSDLPNLLDYMTARGADLLIVHNVVLSSALSRERGGEAVGDAVADWRGRHSFNLDTRGYNLELQRVE